ncbi:hypothetical protein ACTFIW_001510 [Dictyostelium discoideum]
MNHKLYQDIQQFTDSIDQNKDGVLTAEEIYNSFLKKMNGNKYEASKATGILCSTIDTNKDGKFSQKEIGKYRFNIAKKRIEENSDTAALADVQALLLRLDTEFLEYFKEQGAYTPNSDCDYILKIIDLDKDGCVSLSELQKWFKKRRLAMPTNPSA